MLMFRKLLLGLILGLITVVQVHAQGTGVLQGKVLDESNNQPVPFAIVVAKLNGVQKGFSQATAEGKYRIPALPGGTYVIEVKATGYGQLVVNGLSVGADRTTFQDFKLSPGITTTSKVDITASLVDKGRTTTGAEITAEQIKTSAIRNPGDLAALSSGVTQSDDGAGLNIRGGREEQTAYFVDGIRMRGTTSLPKGALAGVNVATGGISAQYGDATSGVISITTQSGASKFSMGGEILTSQYLDPYGYNLAALNFSGPILKKSFTNAAGQQESRTILSYFLAVEAEKTKDGSPSALGVWQLKDDVLKSLQTNPLRPSPTSSGFVQNALFVTADDMTLVKARPNAGNQRLSLTGKLDFTPTNKITITLGGTYDNQSGMNYNRVNSLFNSANFSNSTGTTTRVYGRYKQSFGGETNKESTSKVKPSYFQIQVDYTKTTNKTEVDGLGTNPFNYGYHGKFDERWERQYESRGDSSKIFLGSDTTYYMSPTGDTLRWVDVNAVHSGFAQRGFSYTAGTVDPTLSAYNNNIFGYLNTNNVWNFPTAGFSILGGYLNGQMPTSVYGIWQPVGLQSNGFGHSETNMFRLTGQASVDVGNHHILFGLEFDQRTDRSWSVNPLNNSIGIWGLARSLTNRHIAELDYKNYKYILNGIDPNKVDTINFERLYNKDNQSTFDANLRKDLGFAATDYIVLDNLDPSKLKLDYFSANELLNNGQGYIGYFGYDYLGNKMSKTPGYLDFFTDTVKRPIAPYAPIYTAGYIEDNFTFDDINFKVGVRVDRFDANQPVLKDNYLLYPAKTAGEVDGKLNPNGAHPGTIGNNYVVYVNSETNPTTILGYRDGNRWYNANGAEISNASGLAQNSVTGRITPYLVTPGVLTKSDGERGLLMKDAFTQYKPQINVMPRIAFTFPISDDAMFFAHYDVLTKRPSNNFRFDPTDYYYLANVGGTINNPGLKPEKTIDYQLGYKQAFNKNSALTITAYYREMRNMVQVIPVNFAYPVNYFTYGNIDFGNVKGFGFDYVIQPTTKGGKKSNLRLTASYTLQFASGTGSNANSAGTFVNLGLDAIRTPFYLSYDARHRLVATVDYRYGVGSRYNGPENLKKILQGFGINFTANYQSGTPYTRQRLVTPAAAFGITARTQQKGDINSSRLPGQFRVTMRLEKQLSIVTNPEKNKALDATISLQIFNLLDAQNVLGAYAYTGSSTDDGYLTSPLGNQQLQGVFSQQSFIDLYRSSMDNPGFYSLPRRIRLGINFNL